VLTVLHLSPHPDDEIIGAGATLMALRDAGHRIVNLACSLGRPDHSERRLRELEEACARARFELVLHDPPLEISHDDDLVRPEETLGSTLRELVASEDVSIVVSPSPHDGHPGHEAVGRATRDALRSLGRGSPSWWMWGLWDDLSLPTLVSEFDGTRMDEVLHALSAYSGELARNDYRVMVEARARMNKILGPERVFGFGSRGTDAEYVELLTEALVVEGRWHRGASRLLDPKNPRSPARTAQAVDRWLDAPSVRQLVRDGPG
jgi:LmbE family N-acetylglucosaminyl deacetylase